MTVPPDEPGPEEVRRRFEALVESAGWTPPAPDALTAGDQEESGRADGGPLHEPTDQASTPPTWPTWPEPTRPKGAGPDGAPQQSEVRPTARGPRWPRGPREDDDYDPEFHFHPDPPAPLPRHDVGFWATVGGLVGGCLLTLYLVLVQPNAHPLLRWVAGVMVAVGFVLLVLRSPTEHDEDDDGARV